ncbi:MAG TPA: phosphate signaling complex protein PhoU [Gaiella sp.]|uniref:phosphate signaling complex protein PhoU n=1 Tax=Gaiella sp. TaxID=2663207 RepID=UPI002D7F2773|nr:phosphate signaling complex protein PhoU [Gaiella sp.]HET9287018.1 phosphate signaling complex protein PhoU [Gaiella sp.]
MRVEYRQRLEGLEASLQEQGDVCLRALRGALDALEAQDAELCDEVIAFDDEIDERYHRIEKLVEEILALETPVAGDLRLVLAILHDSIHLERIGDQSVTIAKLTKLTADLETRHDLVEGLREMGERCEEMVRIALDSFAERDLERARSLHVLDELVDRTNRRVTGKVLEMAPSPGLQEWGMRMIIVARCLERVGDNAVDIGEQTAFVVTGEFQEFSDASH